MHQEVWRASQHKHQSGCGVGQFLSNQECDKRGERGSEGAIVLWRDSASRGEDGPGVAEVGTHWAVAASSCISPSKPAAASALASSSRTSSATTSSPATRPPARRGFSTDEVARSSHSVHVKPRLSRSTYLHSGVAPRLCQECTPGRSLTCHPRALMHRPSYAMQHSVRHLMGFQARRQHQAGLMRTRVCAAHARQRLSMTKGDPSSSALCPWMAGTWPGRRRRGPHPQRG